MSGKHERRRAILGIDAAWTAHEPSGIALIRSEDQVWRCLAVAPSYDSFIGLADGHSIDWGQASFPGSVANTTELLRVSEQLAGCPVDVVSVDMPIATVSISARRNADKAVSREFGGRWCSAHTPSQTRPGAVGLALSTAFVQAGYPIATTDVHEPARCLLEVYPHPALLSLLGSDRRVPYKVSKAHRYLPGSQVSQRIAALLAEYATILGALEAVFGNTGLLLPAAGNVACLAHLKKFEDVLDGLVCAWVGAEYLAGRTVPLGDQTAAIWCPIDVVHGA